MGDRYTITADEDQLHKRFKRDLSDRYTPFYNAAPTQVLPLITQGSKGFSYFFWGQLPERSKNKPVGAKLLYADALSLQSKPSNMNLLSSARCLIPADGFYAWKQVSKKGRIAHRFTQDDNAIFGMAGIWEEFEDDEGHIVHTFRIITTPAPASAASVTTVIPFILPLENEDKWLDNTLPVESAMEILNHPSEKRLRSYTVSPRIDDPEVNSPSLIKPFSPADQFGNYSLFD